MKVKEFEEHVLNRCSNYVDLNYCIIALNGEAGEVAEWYKKAILRGNPGDKYTELDLKHELGDVLFYLTRICKLKNWTLKEVMDANVIKLKDRAKVKVKE